MIFTHSKSPSQCPSICRPFTSSIRSSMLLASAILPLLSKSFLDLPRGLFYLRKRKGELYSFKLRAEKIIDKLDEFSFEKFEKRFLNNSGSVNSQSKDVRVQFDNMIAELRKERREGSAVAYETAKNALRKYRSKIFFKDVTYEFLLGFENFMLKSNHSYTTVGIYCRHLRAIINKAIDDGIIKHDIYPFKKYKIPNSRNIKKALSFEEIKQLIDYQPITAGEERAKDFWLFSYMCNGMNMKDICQLQVKNIFDEFIVFNRAKTINTKRKDIKPIKVPIIKEVEKIIERWGNLNKNYKEAYIFPVLDKGLNAVEQRKRISNFNRYNNKQLKKIAVKLELEGSLSNMTAKHSFATVLKRKGISAEIISESLGHSSLRTTENYLDSFTDEIKKETAKLLTDI